MAANSEGSALIKAWHDAVDYRDRTMRDERRARSEEEQARHALAKFLAPKDAKPGEKFSIWDRDREGREVLFELIVPAPGEQPSLCMRRR